jgi:uroporphyrinogen-III synthase
MPDDGPLAGLTVVVTRPRQQGEITAMALRAAGAEAIELPVLEITPLAATLNEEVVARASLIIFVSANAVEHGLKLLRRRIPGGAQIAAIGEATTRALSAAGFTNVVSPQQSIDSEGLLAMPQLQTNAVNGQHVILIRGKSESGGRRLLESALASRGANVTVLECYRRRDISPPVAEVNSLVESMSEKVAVMALSVETLESLLKVFALHPHWLQDTWLLVPNARVASAARARGFQQVAEVGMSAQTLIAALVEVTPRMRIAPQ